MLAFRLLVPPSSIKVRGCTDRVGIIAGRADLSDMGQEPAEIMDRVLGTAVQVQDPVYVLFMAKYIRTLVT